MKRNSLFQQGQQAIIASIAIGQSKRSDTRRPGGRPAHKIYSVSYLNDLKVTNKELMSFIRAEYPDCRYIRDIRPDMLQDWLDRKAADGVSQEHMGKLISHLRKLEACYKYKYSGINLHLEKVEPSLCKIKGKQRDKVMDDVVYKTLLGAMHKKTQAYKSVVLSHALGLRINETARIHAGAVTLIGGRWGYGRVVLMGRQDGCKGGRYRVVDILSKDDRDAVKSCLEGVKSGDFIITKLDGGPYEPGSLQRAIDRAADKTGLTDWHQNKNHALRKNFAQRAYNLVRESGGDKKEALGYVNEQLGHGRNRRNLNAVYVADQW